jgi:hypothetical protein
VAPPRICKILGQESAMQHWVDEVGRELRYVEVQIGFFQAYVDSRIHRAGHRPAP